MASHAEKVILVEGMDDLHAIAGVFRQLELTEFVDRGKKSLSLQWQKNSIPLDIISAGSVDQAKDFDETLANFDALDDCNVLALILDADQNPQARWDSVANRLRKKGYEVSDSPDKTGAIIPAPDPGLRKIGLWVMPNNESSGMLESFLAYCVPKGDGVWENAQAQTEEIHQQYAQSERFKDAHLDKAKIHTYLAWKEPSGLPFGQAIVKGIFDSKAPLAKTFIDWICRLFEFPLA